MSYQVLARRWRPKTFSELVGQAHVVRALSNALENDRLHHAYLFTGTRGVGKTTIARILAKSLNCEQGVTTQPCGECSICREVDEGRFVDLIEVDAASKTGVDDTRELLENVPYAPVRGRYKVYLIDEVHMFSSHSFNALLKTLEEPPPHVKFLLATTDPQKVPVTVLSRCLQFSLNRLPIEQIQGQFEHILGEEGIEHDTRALYLLARAADGSMRDGLSLLDQAIAFGGGRVDYEAVRDMLGVSASDLLPELLERVQQGDAAGMLEGVRALAEKSPDFAALLKDLLLLLHRVALLQATPEAWSASWGERERFEALAAALSPEETQLYYQIALVGQRDLPLAPDAQSGFEMVLLRMLAFRPDDGPEGQRASAPTRAAPASAPSAPPAEASAPPAAEARETPAPVAESAPAGEGNNPFGDWHALLPRLGLSGMAAQLAAHSAVRDWDGHTLTLAVDASCASLLGSLAEQRLLEALRQYAGELRLQWHTEEAADTPAQRQQQARMQRERQAREDIAADPLVQALQDGFDAELVEDSIRPVEH
ncbi:DNA polymerase III subunit gamma/tau [endosymbiont of unidentified scaly snail isolate Monju]|uniref:DNA polymerase III subunit gamma/tau n=1 Tax=endosymbiont of unidentified scaly snail isolate Monju TaxID=1248727 RepID=UPI0003891A63|nr:DNA polymerase III subunit gamma/tau [endosymbiont of unidentified scaly snail isolate Monju]BAN68650.1 DNA polymerase III subunit gamma/tau [endosymbiont of unidentified scaly snail isolate Monju]